MLFHSYLLVDAGNTRVKWTTAAFTSGHARAITGEMPTADATPARLRALRKKFDGHFLVLASVVPRLTADFARIFKRGFHSVTGESPALGLEFDYPNPAEIGADRLAAAVAIRAEKKAPVIIASCGTATAFTVLDAQGRLCGGIIAPGLQTQLDSLLGATAQLPATALAAPKSPLAKSTREAIRAGVLLNFQGGAKEIIRQLAAALPDRKKPAIILTGGHAAPLSAALDLPHTVRPLLVLEGLRIIGPRVHPYRAQTAA